MKLLAKTIAVEDFLLIYKTYIRPRLEFCIQSWSPYLHKDIETLERVQRTATRLVPQLRKFCYEERLRKLGLTTLKERRLRGDMIEVFKLLGGWEKIYYRQFFPWLRLYNTRGHNQCLYREVIQGCVRCSSASELSNTGTGFLSRSLRLCQSTPSSISLN